MIHTHTQIIIDTIKKKGFKSYLEIGVHVPEHNHYLIPCQFKVGVDPNPNSRATFTGTSDEFFKEIIEDYYDGEPDSNIWFDAIFIDGLHWSEQVKKDFDNSLACLNEGGIIFIHDTDPKEERFSVYPRKEPRRWNGDVMKFIAHLPSYSCIDWRTPNWEANGLTVVKRSTRVAYDPPYGGMSIDWKTFREHREEILQLCSKEEFDKWI